MPLRAAHQAKECESIPLRARDMPGHRAQRLVYALLIAKAFFQHLHGYAPLVELASEPGAWCGQAGRRCRLLPPRDVSLRRPLPAENPIPIITMMPQAQFLDFLVEESRKLRGFQVIMNANVQK